MRGMLRDIPLERNEMGSREPGSRDPAEPAQVVLLECSWWPGGHPPIFVREIAHELVSRGLRVGLICGIDNRPQDVAVSDYLQAPRIPVDRPLRGLRWLHAACHEMRQRGYRHLVDLNLDLSLARLGPWVYRDWRGAVGVLHATDGLARRGRPGRGTLRVLLGRLALALGRRRPGFGVVVHTPSARTAVSRLGCKVRWLPVPIRPARLDRSEPRPPATEGDFFLFLGDARREKGLDLLVQAFASTTLSCELLIAGPDDDRSRAALAVCRDRRVRHLGFVDDGVLAGLFARCIAAVVPYRNDFCSRGTASTVAVEALVAGAPLIAPVWMREQLEGVESSLMAYEPESLDGLKGALTTAAAGNGSPLQRPRSTWRAGLALRHGFPSYVEALLANLSLGAVEA